MRRLFPFAIALFVGCSTPAPRDGSADLVARAAVVCVGYADTPDGPAALDAGRPGRVAAVHVKVGQTVSAGCALVSLDDREAAAAVEQAKARQVAANARLAVARQEEKGHPRRVTRLRAEVSAAEARMSSAEIVLKRLGDLESRNLGNRDEVKAQRELVKSAEAGVAAAKAARDEADAVDPALATKAAEAEVDVAKAAVAAAEAAREMLTIKAPTAGTILSVGARVGEATAEVLFAPAGPIVVRAEVEQELASRVKAGMRVSVRDELATGAAVAGTVERVGGHFARRKHRTDPTQFSDVPTVEVIVRPDAAEVPWRIGQKLRVAVFE